jgi:hypothetical protein
MSKAKARKPKRKGGNIINARKKGIAYELDVIKKLKPLYPSAVSSRSESKSLDDRKVDICYTGMWRVQCKAVEALGSAHQTLTDMEAAKLDFEEGISVVFHKRNNKGTVVSLQLDDFLNIIKTIDYGKLQLLSSEGEK